MNAYDEFESLAPAAAPAGAAPSDDSGELGKGLRRGWASAGGQLQSLAGGLGAAGAEQLQGVSPAAADALSGFAASRRAAATADAQEAADPNIAARVSDFRKVGGLKDGWDYAVGKLGESAPALGAGIAGGAAAALARQNPLVGATLATAPLDVGSVLQRQQEDPEAQARGATDNLGRAALAGGASSVLSNIVPAALGGKLVGGAAERVGGGFIGSAAREAAVNAAAGAGSEAVQQLGVNPNAPFDQHAIEDAAVGGGVLGGVMGGAGHAAESLHGAPTAAYGAVKGAVSDLGQAAKDKVQGTAPPMPSTVDDIKAATAAPEPGPATMEEGAAQAKTFGEKLMDRADLSPEARQKVAEAMDNAQDFASQAYLGAQQKAMQAKDAAVGAAQRVADRFKPAADAPADGSKQSADADGARQAIVQALLPHVPETVMHDPDTLQLFGQSTMNFIDAAKKGNVDDLAAASRDLSKMLGPDAENVLAQVFGTVGDHTPAQTDKFFGTLSRMRDAAQADHSLRDVITQSLPDSAKTGDTGKMFDALSGWARGDKAHGGELRGAQAEFFHAGVRNEVAKHFGPNTERVMQALEEHALAEQGIKERKGKSAIERDENDEATLPGKDQSSDVVEPQHELHSTLYDKDKNPVPMLDPALHRAKWGSESPAERLMKDLKAKGDPESPAEIKFVSEHEATGSGSRERGFVAVSKEPMPDHGALSAAEERKLAMDDGHKNSPSRLDVGGKKLDAVKLARTMSRKMPSDGLTDAQRTARGFVSGLAQLMERRGAFDVPDHTVVGKGMTFADVKDILSKIHEGSDGDGRNDLASTSERLQAADKKLTNVEKAMLAVMDGMPKEPNADQRANMGERLKELRQDWEEANAKREEVWGKDSAERSNEARGKQAPSKDEEIHTAAKTLSESALAHTSNMDGTPHSAPRPVKLDALTEKGLKLARGTAIRLANDGTAIGKKIGERLQKLVNAKDSMSAKDLRELAKVGGLKDASEVAGKINDLARKYAGVIAKPEVKSDGKALAPAARERQAAKEGPPGPKAVAAKKAALTERALSGDPALTKELRASDDAKGLQRAAEHLAATAPDSAALKAANDRLGELVQNPDTAYGMQTRKYSLESTRIHNDLERPGFAATHDSPIKHEGKFAWRDHELKGEGAAAFGSGTYLSTGDSVHKYYKAMMTRKLEDEIHQHGGDMPEGGPPKSPTYHVSVEHDPEHLLNWDKPLGEQSAHIQDVLKDEPITQALVKADMEKEEGADGGFFMPPTGGEIYRAITKELGSQRDASDYLQALGVPGHEYAAANGRNGKTPNYVIYDDSKIHTNYVHFSRDENAGGGAHTPEQRAEVKEYLDRVLGDSVKRAWADLTHAGDFTRTKLGDLIRISIHALNPKTVAYHESLHALFAQLRDAGAHDIVGVIDRAAAGPVVRAQLEKFFKGNEAVLAQLKDPEERSAYMYQLWANGQLKLGGEARTVFQKVADYVRNLLGIWSNDQRALHIMEYFSSGEYAKNMHNPNEVARALMEPGRNAAWEVAKSLARPAVDFSEKVFSTGDARVRDVGNDALTQIADLVKTAHTGTGTDPGYIPASRAERADRMNRLANSLQGHDRAALNEALEALQRGEKPASLAARTAAATVKKALRDTYDYMSNAGVKIGDLGPDYFPRVWDGHYVSTHQDQFRAMIQKYVDSGEFKGDPKQLMSNLMSNDGAEFNVDTRRPGMQHQKERILAFVKGEDAAPFLNKDMYQTLNGYIAQATRRAEWARRFGDNSERLDMRLEQARKTGATDAQIAMTEQYLKGVNGTLGDNINPTARRLMGNMIVYQNLRLLPLAIFSSVVDPLGIVVRGGTAGDAFKAFKRGVAEIPRNFKKFDPDARDAATRLAETLGVVDNAALVHSLGALYSQGMVSDVGRKVNDTFFRLNMMEQFNTSMRVSATEAALKFMETHGDGTASRHSTRWMQELGLGKGDVRMKDGRVALTTADGLSAEHAVRMRDAVNKWVDGAILRPDAADKPVWMNDPHFALVSHLKQFVYSFQRTILDRVMHEMDQGNYTPAYAMLAYVPTMIAADYLKGMIQGGGQQPDWKKDWGIEDYVSNGIQRAGLYGVGQFGVDVAGNVQHGGMGIGALAGPTFEQLGDAAKVLGGREQFKDFAVHAMPANTLYARAFGGGKEDPKFAD